MDNMASDVSPMDGLDGQTFKIGYRREFNWVTGWGEECEAQHSKAAVGVC